MLLAGLRVIVVLLSSLIIAILLIAVLRINVAIVE
jgi:hypothetical protein